MNADIEIQIPFQGFYHSWYSDAVDSEETQWAENEAEYRQKEDGVPPELYLTQDEFWEIRYRNTKYAPIYHAVAKAYVDAFNYAFDDWSGFCLGLVFEEMTSPREYNFETDRIFCRVPLYTVLRMFWLSEQDGHKLLTEVIAERHTSYSGFHSYYNNDLESWLEKPVTEWDSQELQTLLITNMLLARGETVEGRKTRDWEEDVFEYASTDSFCQEADEGVDWEKVDAEIADRRAELEAESRSHDPDFVPPVWRCPNTLDMFQNK